MGRNYSSVVRRLRRLSKLVSLRKLAIRGKAKRAKRSLPMLRFAWLVLGSGSIEAYFWFLKACLQQIPNEEMKISTSKVSCCDNNNEAWFNK